MNISHAQMKAIRGLLSKKDKEVIAMHTGKSVRTIDAVLQFDRVNDQIEASIIQTAKQNLQALANVIADIEAKNVRKVTTEEYRNAKNSNHWSNDYAYGRYLDIYLQLSHIKFTSDNDLWDNIWQNHKDIITTPVYCIDLFVRLLGLEEKHAVSFFNKKIQNL
jgi:hypothetical protein